MFCHVGSLRNLGPVAQLSLPLRMVVRINGKQGKRACEIEQGMNSGHEYVNMIQYLI